MEPDDDSSWMNIWQAAQNNSLTRLRSLVTASTLNSLDVFGRTPMHCAALYGQEECVSYLLSCGAETGFVGRNGRCIVHYVVVAGHEGVLRLLLDAGALFDAPDNDGLTPLGLALRWTHRGCARLLIDRGASLTRIANIPDWVQEYLTARTRCRNVAVVLIGLHKYHRAVGVVHVDVNVWRICAKHIWASRMDDEWDLNLDNAKRRRNDDSDGSDDGSNDMLVVVDM
jgi:hypothetical protein